MSKRCVVVTAWLWLAVSGCGDDGAGPNGRASIGPEGGTITSEDGRLTLTIPEGALAVNTEIAITKLDPAEWPAELAALEPITDLYDIQPDGTTFAVPVTMTWSFDAPPSDVIGDALVVPVGIARSGSGALSQHLDTYTTASDAAFAITSTIDHLSTHAVYKRELNGFTIGTYQGSVVGGSHDVGAPWSPLTDPRSLRVGGELFAGFLVLSLDPELEFQSLGTGWAYGSTSQLAETKGVNAAEMAFGPVSVVCKTPGPTWLKFEVLILDPSGLRSRLELDRQVECLPISSGQAWEVIFDKINSVVAGIVEKSPDNAFYLAVYTGIATLTVIDPAALAMATGKPGDSKPGTLHHAAMDIRQVTFNDASNEVRITEARGLGGGAILFAGTRRGFMGKPYIAKLKADDTIEWATEFGVASQDSATRMADLGAAGWVVGFGNAFGNGKLQVARFDTDGAIDAVITLGVDQDAWATVVAPRTSGGYFVVGDRYVSAGPGAVDTVLVAMNNDNTIAWQKVLSNGGQVFARSIHPLGDDGLLFVGSVRDINAIESDGLLVRFAANGSVLWQKRYPGTRVESAIATSSGYRVAAGVGSDMALFEVQSSDGTIASARTYNDSGTTTDEHSRGIGTNTGGGVTLLGYRHDTHSWIVYDTAPDGTVAGCGDSMIGASLATTSIQGVTSTVNVADHTMSATVDTAPATAALTALAPQRVNRAPTNTCGP